ncbi:heat shock protein 30 [Bisporella sp. PMI_857]|nr:heat shock protein 30 [Bisporella sp. PMI_857]
MSLIYRSNDALKVNPAVGDTISLSTGGSDWLWAVTALYSLSLLLVVAHSYFARSGEKILHYLFTISLFVGAISYFTVASNLGSTPVVTSTNQSGTRQIFYARYINWFVSWPPLITAIGLFSGVSWATIVYNVALSWVWVASWLSGALVATTYKWGFFVFGIFAYFLLSASLLHTGSITSKRLAVGKSYLAVSGWLVFVWFLYPIAYGLADGGNKIGVTQGWIFFGILDIITVPFLSFAILVLARKWDYRALNLYFTQYGRVPPPSGTEATIGEKRAPGGPAGEQAAPGNVAGEQIV